MSTNTARTAVAVIITVTTMAITITTTMIITSIMGIITMSTRTGTPMITGTMTTTMRPIRMRIIHWARSRCRRRSDEPGGAFAGGCLPLIPLPGPSPRSDGEKVDLGQGGATHPFSSFAGRGWRQPGEGLFMTIFDYIRDPAEIYRQSFATIRAEADLSRFAGGLEKLVIRLIHACGMVDLANDIAFSEGAFEAGAAALERGAPVLVDVEMVRHGIIRRLLPADNEILCLLNDERVRPKAAEIGNTRSAAQVDLWDEHLEGAVVAIGNAPTALFRLLERIDAGAPKPAIILGFPVGFVGAAESKEALIADSRGIPYIAARGRRGGSAMASAAVNALAGGLGTNV